MATSAASLLDCEDMFVAGNDLGRGIDMDQHTPVAALVDEVNGRYVVDVLSRRGHLGKPKTPELAREMLNDLRGKRHTVLTGVCAMCTESEHEALGVSRSAVKFCDFTDDALDMYVASGEPLDRAGAYAIQGGGSAFVEAVAGRIDTVIGLDVGLALRLLGEIGYPDPLPRTTDINLTASRQRRPLAPLRTVTRV